MEEFVYFTSRGDPSIKLEGVLGLPKHNLKPSIGVILCHPHPLYGGSMDVPLIRELFSRLVLEGFVTLRFNFRGVGRSQGQHSGGVREVRDVAGAVDFLASEDSVEASRFYVVGYSFGAFVGLKYAPSDDRIAGVAAIGLPLYAVGKGFLAGYPKPKLFIAGQRDPICPPSELRVFVEGLLRPWEVQVLPDADHLFLGYEAEVALKIARTLSRWDQEFQES